MYLLSKGEFLSNKAMRLLRAVLLITLGVYCAAALFMPLPLFAAVKSGDSATPAAGLSGVWNTTDTCFPDTPYTMLLDQNGSILSLTSTAGDNPTCSGTVSGGSIDLTCSHTLSSGEPFALTGTIVDNDSISLTYLPDNGSLSTCSLTKHGGMDPMVQAMLKFTNISEAIKPLGQRTPGQMRRYVKRMNSFTFLFPAIAVAKARTIKIPGPGGKIPLRIYTPEGGRPFSCHCLLSWRRLGAGHAQYV